MVLDKKSGLARQGRTGADHDAGDEGGVGKDRGVVRGGAADADHGMTRIRAVEEVAGWSAG